MTDPAAKTTALFEFLKSNREIPQSVQLGYRQATLLPFESTADKAFALLHGCYYTQSSVRMNIAKNFFRDLAAKPSALSSFSSFCRHLDADAKYESLHQNLAGNKNGWGPKTAALFLKNVFQIHHSPGLPISSLKFWNDTPNLTHPDRLYLPVDAVITKVFEYLQLPGKPFEAINAYLQQKYQPKDLEIWDDLWFWGFITQEGSGAERKNVTFNEGKYWSILHAPKDMENQDKIKKLCIKFYEILNSELVV